MALAAFLLFMSFLANGRVPGLTADESAALGFLFFFGLGLPLLLLVLATFVMSIYIENKLFIMLAALLFLSSILAFINVWSGLCSSLVYLCLSVWALLKPNRGKIPH